MFAAPPAPPRVQAAAAQPVAGRGSGMEFSAEPLLGARRGEGEAAENTAASQTTRKIATLGLADAEAAG